MLSIYIPSSVTFIDRYAFDECFNLTIYCSESSKPSRWHESWNHFYTSSLHDEESIPVVWSCEYYGIYNDFDYIVYKKRNGDLYAEIVGYVGTNDSVNIPETINVEGKEIIVTSIGDSAFRNCSSLTSITIPSSVTSIGDSAFRNCSSLTSITIPSSVTSIGDRAFMDCSSLTSLVIPANVVIIGDFAFLYCDSLTIYCEVSSKPSYWSSTWNESGGRVIWGHKG